MQNEPGLPSKLWLQFLMGLGISLTTNVNLDFLNWRIKDKALLSLINSTLTPQVLSLAVGITTFGENIKIARDKLHAVGVIVDDEELICIVLRGLPKKFAHFYSAIGTRSDPIEVEEGAPTWWWRIGKLRITNSLKMKATLIVCLLLASIFFIPSSNAAEKKCDPYTRRSCLSKPPAQPLKPVAPPLKPPTQPLKPVAPPLKPVAPPLKPPTEPLKPVPPALKPPFNRSPRSKSR
ncbi:hypothetical protein SO802_002317 [Lithocarpus litseifolius]|uniref:Uncharacterized protein n=1 Tax=Lithocarpus litseifolius TaxID=425828 RepID=A0AAW2E0I4_9ROSI